MSQKSTLVLKNVNVKNDSVEKDESYRCNACCVELSNVDELIDHVNQSHVNSEGHVACEDCQYLYQNIDDFLKHYHHSHGYSSRDSKVIQLPSLDEIDPIASEIPENQVVNNEDETVSLASNDSNHDSQDAVNDRANPRLARKRRSSAKQTRQILYESPFKRFPKVLHAQQSPAITTSESSEVEIDISDVNVVRLKSSKSDNNEKLVLYLQRVEDKLDSIIKHFNVPYTPTVRTSTKNKTPKRWNAQMTNDLLTPEVVSHSVARQGDVHFIAAQTTQQEITHYIISDELLEAMLSKSRNRGNFAKNLVFAAFPLEERVGRNCYGRRGGSLSGPKGPLEAAKLEAVREAVFKKYPIENHEEEETVWKRECVIAIDTALRSELRLNILKKEKAFTP